MAFIGPKIKYINGIPNATEFPNMTKIFTKLSNKYNLADKKRTAFEYMKEYRELYKHMNDIDKMSAPVIYKKKPSAICYNINIKFLYFFVNILSIGIFWRAFRHGFCFKSAIIVKWPKTREKNIFF